MTLVHLHAHNEYSLLDGQGTAIQHAVRAAEMGQPALASTNHGTLAGALHHMNACREAGLLPIVGCEVYYRPNRLVQGVKEWRYNYWHLTLLAKNARGWLNLMRIVSESHDSGFYEKPCADTDLLERYHEGVICGLGCLGSWLSKCIADGDSTAATAWVRQLKNIFREDLFGEIMPSSLEDQIERNLGIISVCDEEGVMKCATVDAHSPSQDTVDTQDVLLMINTNQTVKQREEKRAKGEDIFEFKDKTYYLQSEHEVRDNFAKFHPEIHARVVDEAITNTLLVASRVQPFLVGRHEKLPQVKRELTAEQIIVKQCEKGMAQYGKTDDPEYQKRRDFELQTFREREIFDYFVMVWETVSWAKSPWGVDAILDMNTLEWGPGPSAKTKRPIMVGPGRGSAAGCLVSYLLGITGLDPISYKLLFERFLNPNRKGLPDIDVDFPTDRIPEVEEFTKHRFGKDHVIDVIAHTTFGPRAAIADVSRVLSIPTAHYREVTKTIDEDDRSPLEEIRKVNPSVEAFANQYPEAYRHATVLQGQIARKSEHAAALLVTPPEIPVKDAIPIERTGGMKGKLITAWGERAGKGNAILSDYGYVKFDWLRIAELDKQAFACELIKDHHGIDIDLDQLEIHQDPRAVDPDVMKAFGDGFLTGVFQFSATAKKLTRRMKPDWIGDLAAINALIRPGPRGHGDDQRYIERKHGREQIVYWHDKLIPYLEDTLGILVFQEQLIEVVHQLGGLSRPDADNFRKIASKLYRDPEFARSTMHEWKEPIFEGFLANGLGLEESELIWENFLSFSDYSFNLSHAAGYAVLAYRDQWLKVKYPKEFYAAFLSKGLSGKKELAAVQKQEAVREARQFGVRVLPPDVNQSGTDYTVTEDGIRLGLVAITNVGQVAAKAVIDHRPYSSYSDFESRVPARQCNITSKAALVCAGAFDSLGMRNDYTEEKIDAMEREYIGVSMTSDFSMSAYAHLLDEHIWPEDEFDEAMDGTRVVVGGEVTNIKHHRDAKGKAMAFVDLAYGSNEWSCTFFASIYPGYKELLESRRPIAVIGEKSTWKGRSSIVVEKAMDARELATMLEEPQPTAA